MAETAKIASMVSGGVVTARDYLSALRRNFRVVLVAALIGVLFAGGLSLALRQQPVQSVTASANAIFMSPEGLALLEDRLVQEQSYVQKSTFLISAGTGRNDLLPETVAQVLMSDRIIKPVSLGLGESIGEVQTRVSAQTLTSSNVVTMSVEAPTGEMASVTSQLIFDEFNAQLDTLFGDPRPLIKLLGTTLFEPDFYVDYADSTDLQAAVTRWANELIVENPAFARQLIDPAVGEIDQSLVTALVEDLGIGDDPAKLLTSFSLTTTMGTLDSSTGATATPSELVLSVSSSDKVMAQQLLGGGLALLQQRLATGTDDSDSSISPLVITKITVSDVLATTSGRNRLLTNLILGLLIGLAVGAGYAYLRASRDDTIRRPHHFFAIAATPPVGVLLTQSDRANKDLANLGSAGFVSDGYRNLCYHILYGTPDSRVLCITSADNGEGKLTVAAHLATALAEAGKSVVLVEADVNNPRLASLLGIPSPFGLQEVLRGDITIDAATSSRSNGPAIMCAGAQVHESAEPLHFDRYAAVLAELRDTFDYVVCFSGPLLSDPNAALVAKQAEGVLVTVRVARTTAEHLVAAATSLIQVNTPISGFVITDVPIQDALGWTVFPAFLGPEE